MYKEFILTIRLLRPHWLNITLVCLLMSLLFSFSHLLFPVAKELYQPYPNGIEKEQYYTLGSDQYIEIGSIEACSRKWIEEQPYVQHAMEYANLAYEAPSVGSEQLSVANIAFVGDITLAQFGVDVYKLFSDPKQQKRSKVFLDYDYYKKNEALLSEKRSFEIQGHTYEVAGVFSKKFNGFPAWAGRSDIYIDFDNASQFVSSDTSPEMSYKWPIAKIFIQSKLGYSELLEALTESHQDNLLICGNHSSPDVLTQQGLALIEGIQLSKIEAKEQNESAWFIGLCVVALLVLVVIFGSTLVIKLFEYRKSEYLLKHTIGAKKSQIYTASVFESIAFFIMVFISGLLLRYPLFHMLSMAGLTLLLDVSAAVNIIFVIMFALVCCYFLIRIRGLLSPRLFFSYLNNHHSAIVKDGRTHWLLMMGQCLLIFVCTFSMIAFTVDFVHSFKKGKQHNLNGSVFVITPINSTVPNNRAEMETALWKTTEIIGRRYNGIMQKIGDSISVTCFSPFTMLGASDAVKNWTDLYTQESKRTIHVSATTGWLREYMGVEAADNSVWFNKAGKPLNLEPNVSRLTYFYELSSTGIKVPVSMFSERFGGYIPDTNLVSLIEEAPLSIKAESKIDCDFTQWLIWMTEDKGQEILEYLDLEDEYHAHSISFNEYRDLMNSDLFARLTAMKWIMSVTLLVGVLTIVFLTHNAFIRFSPFYQLSMALGRSRQETTAHCLYFHVGAIAAAGTIALALAFVAFGGSTFSLVVSLTYILLAAAITWALVLNEVKRLDT